MFAARRSIDEQDARRRTCVIMAPLRLEDGIARGEPVDGDLVIGIGKTWPRLAGDRGFP
jgi:hypothetical protein